MKENRATKCLVSFCSVFLAVLMFAASAFAADSTDLVYGQNGTITRAQWLHDLVTVFDMTVEDTELPDHYYQDLTSDKEYYRDMMVAVEFGVIDIPSGGEVLPEEPVTRQFAADTLNYCLGIKYEGDDPAASFSDVADIPQGSRENAQIAVDRSWLALKAGAFEPDSSVTSDEVRTMLDDAKDISTSTEIDKNYNNTFEFAKGVVEVPQESSCAVDGDTVTLYDPEVALETGDVFAVYINGLPQIYKALSIVEQEDGSRVITTEIPEDQNNYQTVDAEGVQEADLATAVAEDGVDITYFVGGTESKGFTDGVPYKDPRLAGNKKIKAVTYEKSISIEKGVNAKVTCTLYNTMLSYKVKTVNREAMAMVTGDVQVTGTVSADLNEISGIPTRFSLGGITVGGVGYIGIYGRINASGKVTVTYQAAYAAGVEHSKKAGTRYIKSFQKTNTTSEAAVELGAGIGIEATFTVPCIQGRVYAETGMKASYHDKVYNDGKSPNWCATYKAWMYAEAGASLTVDYGIDKKKFEKEIVVYSIDNSPVRIIAHKEDGHRVSSCSRDPKDTGFWSAFGYSGIYGGLGDGYGLNGEGVFVPVFTYTTYKNDSNETVAKVTGYTGSTHALVIPDTIDDYTVETIGGGAFAKRSDLSVVVIPDTVKVIEANAFGNCANLQSVQLSANLNRISAHAFYNCDNLTSIQIPKSLDTTDTAYINEYAKGYVYGPFYGCDNLKHISFEEGTKKVARGLFANCPGLEEVTISDTVTAIENDAFYTCNSLQRVTFGSSVTTLGVNAFAKCNLEKVEIPDSVVTIEGGCFAQNAELSSVKLSKNLKKMDAHAFYNCDNLTSIQIPKSLDTTDTEYINEYANGYVYGPFYGCDNLKQVSFEEGTKKIARGLFANCPGPEEITIPDTVTVIENDAFSNSQNLSKVVFPKKLEKIGDYAFNKCSALTEIDLSDIDLSEIARNSFASCTELQTVKLPKNLKEITESLFDGCSKLENIELPESIDRIGRYAFRNSGLTSVVVPSGVTKIDDFAFQASKLQSFTVKDAALSIGSRVFEECKDLTQVDLGKKTKDIGWGAFKNCDSLETITIPDSVTSLNTSIFESCDSLKELKLGTGITEIPQKMCYECGMLEEIVLPYGVTTIRTQAFANCSKLTKITIPKNTKTIADDAFSYFSTLTIYGVSGSYAETYANNKGINFVENTTTATNVELCDTELTLKNGESRKLIITVTPENFTDDVTWRSTDTQVVTVDTDGTIKAKAVGTATVQVNVGNVSARCKVTVVQPVTRINLNKGNAELDAQETLQLTADVQPNTANNKEVTWTSSAPEIASVSEDGLVTALKKGKTTITATAKDGSNVTGTCQITVKNNLYMVSDPTQMESTHPYENNCKDVWVYTSPSDTENLLVTFDNRTSIEEEFDDVLYIYDGENSQIGKYKGTELAGKTITVPGKTVKIKLDTDSAGTDWGFKVTSIKGDGEIEKEDQVLEGQDSYTKAYGDAEFALDMRLAKGDGAISYTSDNPTVATVSENGMVSIKGVGTANITVVAAATKYYYAAERQIEITVEKGKRDFNPSVKRTIQVGKTAQIQAGTEGNVTYTTYDTDVIEVSDTGLITALSEGDATVTVTAEEDEYYEEASADLQVTVVGEDQKVATDLSECTVTILGADNLYADGTAKEPEAEVRYGDNVFAEGMDYTISYKNNVQAGTATMIITALPDGGLDGRVEVTFTIKAAVTGNEVEIKDNAFEGSQNTKVTFGNNLTRIGSQAFKDAELENIYFKGNAPDIAGDAFENVVATVYIPRDNASWTSSNMQSYGGALTWKYWNPSTGEVYENLEEDGEATVLEYCEYDGTPKTPHVNVVMYTVNGTKVLTQGSDYIVRYSNNVNAGTATAVVTGIGHYAGTLTSYFRIDKAQADLEFVNLYEYHQIGEQFVNPLTIRRIGGTVTYRSADERVATVDRYSGLVTVRGVGTVEITATAAEGNNVYGGEDYFILDVEKSVNEIQASDVTRTYSSKVQKFRINAFANGAPLTFASNNKKISVNNSGQVTVAKNYTGKAVIVISSGETDQYEGAVKAITVSVNPSGTSLGSCKNVKGKKMQISWKKNKLVTGYEIQYSTNKNFASGVKKKTVKKVATTKLTITKLTAKKTYYVRIRTFRKSGGTTMYSSWSKAKKVVIKK